MSDRTAGRRVFGQDAAGYDRARLPYPTGVYDLLQERCGLRPGTVTLEVGPGTGIATLELLRRGSSPLVVIEPDAGLAGYLQEKLATHALTIERNTLEDAALPPQSFDLCVAATSFHWIDQDRGLRKIGDALRTGGWFAMWWQTMAEHDAFYEAIDPVLSGIDHPLGKHAGDFARDTAARVADFESVGLFEEIAFETVHEHIVLDAARVRALFSTFSPIRVLAPAEQMRILDQIEAIAREQFNDSVARDFGTIVYTARRKGSVR